MRAAGSHVRYINLDRTQTRRARSWVELLARYLTPPGETCHQSSETLPNLVSSAGSRLGRIRFYLAAWPGRAPEDNCLVGLQTPAGGVRGWGGEGGRVGGHIAGLGRVMPHTLIIP